MSRRLAWLLVLACSGALHAVSGDPVPSAAGRAVRGVNEVDTVLPQKLDLVKIAEEDSARDRKGMAPRFAVPERVSITPSTRGTWEKLGDGQMIWRLRVIGREGTTSLNLGFSRYKMSQHGRLLLYSTDGATVLR